MCCGFVSYNDKEPTEADPNLQEKKLSLYPSPQLLKLQYAHESPGDLSKMQVLIQGR